MENEEVVQLYLDDIIPNRFQPREVFNDQALKELAISIREHGVIQPIIVRKFGEKYEIIAGERRYKASTMAGLTKIPAIVKNLDDKESSKVALIENLQRRDLTPIEEARTYQKILDLDQMTQENLAKTMGKSQSAVSNKLRLLSLPDEVQEALLKDEISERHARSLLNINDKNTQVELLKEIINNKMTVRELDNKIKQLNGDSASDNSSNETSGGNNVTPIVDEDKKDVDSNTMTQSENLFNSSPINNETLFENNSKEEIKDNQNNNNIGENNMNNSSLDNNLNSGNDLFGVGNNSIPEASTNLFGPSTIVDDPTTVDINKIKEQSVGINPVVPEKQTIDPKELVKPDNNYDVDSSSRFIPNFEETTIEKTEDGNEVIGNGLLAGMPVIKPVDNNNNNNNNLDNKPSDSGVGSSLFGASTNDTVLTTQPEQLSTNGMNNLFDNTSLSNDNNVNNNTSLFGLPSSDNGNLNNVNNKNIDLVVSDINNVINNYKNQGYNIIVDKSDNGNELQLVIKINKN